MRWRNSLLFEIVVFPVLVLVACAGLQLFSVLSQRPAWLWYTSWGLGLGALLGALRFGLQVRRRLRTIQAFLEIAPERNFPPSLPVWAEDELGGLESRLQRLVSQQAERLRALYGERKQLETVLQSMAEGVVLIDLAGNVVLWNRASQELFGVTPSPDWQGKPLQAFSRHPVLYELLREAERRQPCEQPITREIEIESKEPRPLSVSVMQICEDGITVSGYILVCYDLTPLKRLESVRADFVANVSHELRTPLTAIKGYAETLLNGAFKDPETARRFLTIIDRHSERLSRLIDDLLTLSNLELGRAELRHEAVVLPDLVAEVLEIVRDKAERGGVTLRQDLPDELPALVGDSDRLHQVLVNLIDNAVKYTPGGGRVTVSAKTVQRLESGAQPQGAAWNSGAGLLASGNGQGEQEWMEVAIADTGCGIPQADIPRLTQRFYRVDKARSRELGGTGLGLAIVKHIVQAHGGFLRIESQLNTGTTMRLFLPLRAPTPHSRAQEEAPRLSA